MKTKRRVFTKDEKQFINDNLFTCSPEAIATILRCDKRLISARLPKSKPDHSRIIETIIEEFILGTCIRDISNKVQKDYNFVYRVIKKKFPIASKEKKTRSRSDRDKKYYQKHKAEIKRKKILRENLKKTFNALSKPVAS